MVASFCSSGCIRILENVSLIFENLFHATGSNETAIAIIQNHYDIWKSYAAIVPLLTCNISPIDAAASILLLLHLFQAYCL